MKKKRLLLVIITAFVIVSAGCGKKEEVKSTEPVQEEIKPEETAPEEKEEETAPEEKVQAEDKQTEETRDEDTQAAMPAAEEEGEKPEKAVENNGGYFLKIGKDVYYRISGENSLSKTALAGDFLNSPNLDPAKGADSDYGSQLMKLDTESLEIESLAIDFGYGPLFSDGKYLYLNEHDGDYTYVKYMALDGSDEGRLTEGQVVGCSEEGALVAVSSWTADPYTSTLSLYRNNELAGSYSSEGGFEYAGINKDGVYFMTSGSEGNEADFYQLPADGTKALKLGSSEPFSEGYASFEQFLSTDDAVYFMITSRDGSAMMISEVRALEAGPGKEDSLLKLDIPDGFAYESGEPMLPVMYEDEGEIGFAANAPYTAMLGSFEEGGDLMFSENGDEMKVIKTAFRLDPPSKNADEQRYISQSAEYVDGALYLIIALAHRTPEEDIGWRESYGIDSMEYVRVGLEDKAELTLGNMQY